jgi:ribosomal protein S18 acetylase RimI-like enzyme
MKFEFIKLTPEWISEVLIIQERSHGAFYQESRESLLSKIEFSPKTCYGVLAGDRLVGYGISFPWHESKDVVLDSLLKPIEENPEVLYIHDIAVVPEYRGFRGGSELLHLMVADAILLELRSAVLVAVSGSSTYWVGHGFKEAEGSVKGYGEGALMMNLFL